MTDHWSTCSLVVRSTQMSGTALAELIGADPRLSRDRGTLMSPRNPQSSRHADSFATIDSSAGDDASLDDHLRSIAAAISRLEPSTWPDHVTTQIKISADRAVLTDDVTIPWEIASFVADTGGHLFIDTFPE